MEGMISVRLLLYSTNVSHTLPIICDSYVPVYFTGSRFLGDEESDIVSTPPSTGSPASAACVSPLAPASAAVVPAGALLPAFSVPPPELLPHAAMDTAIATAIRLTIHLFFISYYSSLFFVFAALL